MSGMTISSGGIVSGGAGIPSQTGNSGKYLTTNGTVTNWGALTPKEIKTAVTNYTSTFTNNNASYTAVTNASVTVTGLSSGKTYTVISWALVQVLDPTGNLIPQLEIDIDGTAGPDTQMRVNTSATRINHCVFNMVRGKTGITQAVCTLKALSQSGSTTLNTNGQNQQICAIAIEE